ncbi:MAG: DUF4830 domain-containing protein [Oscillospiraceae bacterium]|jgi:hypothetical protein|nr:DUF4830 domain-containing protein [Oscillospiraceae bacterium]
MYTAKFNRKKAVIAILLLAAVLCAIIVIAGRVGSAGGSGAALSAVVRNNKQRVGYLESLGWRVEEDAIDEQKVRIPTSFSDVYLKYNALQIAQGFDLTQYGGLEATRYTYKVKNHPSSEDGIVADIIVYKDKIIAGDIQSCAPDGFMNGLKKR